MICGVISDDGISEALKVHITFKGDGENAEDINIVAYYIEGSSISLSNSYIEPFSGDQIGEMFSKASALLQTQSDITFNTVLNSVSIWEGTQPMNVPLTLYFHAYNDADKEVNEPIRQLLKASSAELNNAIPIPTSMNGSAGRVPKLCMFDIGRKMKIPMSIIDVQYELDAPKTRDGFYAYNTVTITCTPKKMLQRSEIGKHFL